MLELIKGFPAQLLKAIEIGEKANFKMKPNAPIQNVVVCGLGGSGIGGNILSELLRSDLGVPVIVNKGYFLPAFTNASTLLILCSYSGNTEETVACAGQAIEKGLRPVCITSGGKLEEIAQKNGFDLIKIPGGFPPRACLGYAVTQLFFTLHHHGLIDGKFKSLLAEVASFLSEEQRSIMDEAKTLASKLVKKVIIAYSDEQYESTVLRLKQQINENGKMHCWHNVFPELNHNELVGWRGDNDHLALVIFRADDEYKRNTHRILFTEKVVRQVSKNVHEVHTKGDNTFEKHFYLIHFGDWLSYHLALLQGFDPTEIEVLIKLKDHMNSIKD